MGLTGFSGIEVYLDDLGLLSEFSLLSLERDRSTVSMELLVIMTIEVSAHNVHK